MRKIHGLLLLGLLLLPARSPGQVPNVISPTAGALVGDSLTVVVSPTSTYQSATAIVAERQTNLLYTPNVGWTGTLSLTGLSRGAQRLIVNVGDSFCFSGALLPVSFIHDTGPVISDQLRVSAGETWTYQFTALPFVGIESGGPAGPPNCVASVTVSNIAPGTQYTFSLYEDSLFQAPIWVTDSTNNPSGILSGGGLDIWQDLQGWMQLQVRSGSLTIASIQIDVKTSLPLLPNDRCWSDKHYGEIIPVVAPTIQSSPLTQTAEVGTSVDFSGRSTGFDSLMYLWYFNNTNLIGCNTNNFHLQLTNLQFTQSGTYTVVITNVVGAVTSSPAMLNVISPVQRRAVPGISVTGETNSSLNVQFTDSPGASSSWQALDTTTLTVSPQYWFDLSTPLPQHRFYRVWQTGTPTPLASSNLISMVPAITLTGNIGNSIRVDYINAIGPTNAWVTLDTVVLTNTSQLYFDVAAPSQPKRFYRLVQVP